MGCTACIARVCKKKTKEISSQMRERERERESTELFGTTK